MFAQVTTCCSPQTASLSSSYLLSWFEAKKISWPPDCSIHELLGLPSACKIMRTPHEKESITVPYLHMVEVVWDAQTRLQEETFTPSAFFSNSLELLSIGKTSWQNKSGDKEIHSTSSTDEFGCFRSKEKKSLKDTFIARYKHSFPSMFPANKMNI